MPAFARHLLAACLALLPAAADAFPDRPIRLVVPYAAGGATDVIARLLAEALGPILPQPVVVENRAGAGGMVGAEAVARAAPDGHTLLLNNTGHAVLRVVVERPPVDPHTSLTGITILAESPMVMLVANNHPARDLREFVALARAAPNQFDYGSTGGGGTLQMAAVLFQRASGVQMNEIPYRGGAPATLDLAAGRIAVVFDAGATAFQTARGGQARAFAVTTAARNSTAPGVPTLREMGVDAEMAVWQAVFAPAATPRPVREALAAAMAQALAGESLRARLAGLGADRIPALGLEATEGYLAAEVTRWEALMRR